MKKIKFPIAFTVAGLFLLPIDHVTPAYIDPGTGSIVLQVVIGAFFSILVAMKLFWRQISTFIGSMLSKTRRNGKQED